MSATKGFRQSVLFFVLLGILVTFQPNYVLCASSNDYEVQDAVFPNDDVAGLKYILLWTPVIYREDPLYPPFKYFGEKQNSFIENNCSYVNCFVTTNQWYFQSGMTKFDAILFNGHHIPNLVPFQFPPERMSWQKYIFVSQGPPDQSLVCSPTFDNFFNWTQTYRLNSDIPLNYFGIKDDMGNVVGPKSKMNWTLNMKEPSQDVLYKLRNKTKAVAWFVSSCPSESMNDMFVEALHAALRVYGLGVDVYGPCSRLSCSNVGYITDSTLPSCNELLERDYFFYLALEDSFEEDYVTSEVARAVMHYTVPIVYGGANYNSFLPPGAYLHALGHTVVQLASLIHRATRHPARYRDFFRWTSHYSYFDRRSSANVCALCEALNDFRRFNSETVYNHFRIWWNPRYEERCKSSQEAHIFGEAHYS